MTQLTEPTLEELKEENKRLREELGKAKIEAENSELRKEISRLRGETEYRPYVYPYCPKPWDNLTLCNNR